MTKQSQPPAAAPAGSFPLFVHLPPLLHLRLQDQADREGRTLAGVARRALEQYLRRTQTGKDA